MPRSNPLEDSVRYVQGLGVPKPSVGVVLGSGLGGFAESVEQLTRVPYERIPHMPRSTVPGHAGNLCFGKVGATAVACMEGRVHLYEGHSPQRIVFGVRLLAALGCSSVLLTNAAGGIAEGFSPGDLMLIVDHLNLTGQNPLVGDNDDSVGPRFPDLSRAYAPELCVTARRAAREADVELKEGVYAAMLGPSYETPAEIRMLRRLGADAVGMSTVLEVIALSHQGVRVGAVSCITNVAAGLPGALLDHAEVEAVARATAPRFARLLSGWIQGAEPGGH
jgi:purine-nucleoside phosphorylase